MLRLPDSWVWDFWIIQDNDNRYHCYFLYASRALHNPDMRHRRAAIGHAISDDLHTWERVQDALVHGSPPSFDQTATWTGSVIHGPDNRWYMYYTGTTLTDEGPLLQQIGLAISDDLYTWNKHDSNPLLRADPQWYERAGGPAEWHDEHWRDPWVFADPDGDGWHMLITARANTGNWDERGVIGHAHSTDLRTWTVEPPLTEPGNGFGWLEVPQVEIVDGRPVLLFNCLRANLGASRRMHVPSCGVWAAPAKSLLGPYDIAAARPLTDATLFVGKLVQNPAGQWQLLAFRNLDSQGRFAGEIIDPVPVRWEKEQLVVSR